MTFITPWKYVQLSCLLPIVTLSGFVLAADTESTDQFRRDEFNINVTPYCSTRVKSSAFQAHGELPSDQTASTPKWDLEILINPETKSWTLVGKEKNTSEDRKLCLLDNGTDDYTQQKWYKAYFK